MKEQGTYFDPTYTTVIDLAGAGGDYDVPALRIRGEHTLARLRDTVIRAYKIGVKIVTGGDASYGPNSLTRIGQDALRRDGLHDARGGAVGDGRQRRDER
jgi:hypothetical protein